MNKKAALLHWIVFGVIASVALFLILSESFAVSSQVKGQWQIDFLENYVYRAEVDLLQLNADVQQLMGEIIVQLAQRGGHNSISYCGEHEAISLWNNGQEWCFPNVKEQAKLLLLLQLKLKPAFTNIQDSGVVIQDNAVRGQGPLKQLKSQGKYAQQYTYHYDFNAPLGYSFGEYTTLLEEAQKLVNDCRNVKYLASCLEKRPSHWQSCPEKVDGRVVSFCIDSPSNTQIKNRMLQYKIALDFTPTTPFIVEELVVERKENLLEIRFVSDRNPEQFKIYYTDWSAVEEKSGNPVIVFQDFTEAFGNFKKEIIIQNSQTEHCPIEKIPEEVYRCDKFIAYLLDDAALTEGRDYYFAVTAVKESKESEIAQFVKV